MYLIGVDLDKVDGSELKRITAKRVCKSVGSYCEISPSGTGIRIFALSKELVGKGQSPSGEMYHKGRFLTVTGHGHARDVVIATDTLKSLEQEWWLIMGMKHVTATSHKFGKSAPQIPPAGVQSYLTNAWQSPLRRL